MCDADAEFGVSVAIGNGYIYDLVGCGGTRRPTSPYADEPRGAPRPRRAASASLLSTTVLLYTVYLYESVDVADGVYPTTGTGRTRAPCRTYYATSATFDCINQRRT